MKNKILILISIQYFLCVLSYGQNIEWAGKLGGLNNGYPVKLAVDNNDNIICVGNFAGSIDFDMSESNFNVTAHGEIDIFISKYDSIGNFLWAFTVHGNEEEIHVTDCFVDDNGNIYITGDFDGLDNFDFDPGVNTYNISGIHNGDIFIAKYNANGEFVWAKAITGYDNQFSDGISVDNNGNVFIGGAFMDEADFDPGPGEFYISPVGNSDAFFVKLDNDGEFIWAKTLPGNFLSDVINLKLEPNGNILVTGLCTGETDFNPGIEEYFVSAQLIGESFVLCMNNDGEFLWVKILGGTDIVYIKDFETDPDGNIILAGSFKGTADFDPGIDIYEKTSLGYQDVFLNKLDNTGNFVWAKIFGSVNDEIPNAICLNDNQNIMITGSFGAFIDVDPGSNNFELISNGSGDVFFNYLNNNGEFIWGDNIGGPSYDYGVDLCVTNHNDFIFTSAFSDSVQIETSSGTINLVSTEYDDAIIGKIDCSLINSIVPYTINSKNSIFYSSDNNTINFYSDTEFSKVIVEIFDIKGVVKQKTLLCNTNKGSVDVQVSDGFYLVRLIADNKYVFPHLKIKLNN